MIQIYNKICLRAAYAALAIGAATSVPAQANNPVLEPAVTNPAPVNVAAGVNGEALKTALFEPSAVSEDARQHYENSAYRGIWFDATGDAAKAVALMDALKAADMHALPKARYRLPLIEASLTAARSGDPAALAVAEIALTNAFLTYARDVSSGVLEPRTVDRDLHVFPERPIEQALLAGLTGAPDTRVFLAGLAPRHPGYARLQAELADLTRIVGQGDWMGAAPAGGSIRFGERGPRVAAIRDRLAALGDYQPAATPDPAADPMVYDEALETAVRAFQARHGLNADGVIGKRTVAAMNRSAAYRAGQVVVNLERLRWLNRDLGDKHILVNQADFTVKVVDGNQTLFNERVVIGKARKFRTPEFSDQMTHLVLNPTWHVPYSIASKEILPELQSDPEYLAKKNMRLLSRGGGEFDPTLTDWSLYSANDFPFIIKQRPGGGNALGRVKFMFPNQFNIYLHDTPSKRLFRKDARAFSHGCVRVRDPLELARVLLAPQQADPAGYIDRILGQGKERTVTLKTPVQVHLTYRTAWVDDQGVRQFREDVYGRDARILAALRAVGVDAAPES